MIVESAERKAESLVKEAQLEVGAEGLSRGSAAFRTPVLGVSSQEVILGESKEPHEEYNAEQQEHE